MKPLLPFHVVTLLVYFLGLIALVVEGAWLVFHSHPVQGALMQIASIFLISNLNDRVVKALDRP